MVQVKCRDRRHLLADITNALKGLPAEVGAAVPSCEMTDIVQELVSSDTPSATSRLQAFDAKGKAIDKG